MGEDASLDDFLGGESSEQSEADEEATGDDTEATVEAAESTAKTAADDTEATAETDDVEPAATTYAWSDEGATCEACGETVERRWQQDGDLVCIECKDWERA